VRNPSAEGYHPAAAAGTPLHEQYESLFVHLVCCRPAARRLQAIEIVNAIMAALDAHTSLSTQAPNPAAVQSGIKDILLNHSGLWEALRGPAGY
jgi:hypothetical protein